ncbi:uncharacterized protein PV09_06788 [Verruconis gallopava]|uniref:Gamma interferon inducible lysosomal thiol reductase n=1 Tax=Verruconis gallopava TaxID=253628 RepID=A0A0D1XI51_9PEZI|nr:uncharacterized protein PV09_06788 [Verruconis gallopava]KIW01951.1 hypothetical protein PV09_06788 [Verruconis gallopava]
MNEKPSLLGELAEPPAVSPPRRIRRTRLSWVLRSLFTLALALLLVIGYAHFALEGDNQSPFKQEDKAYFDTVEASYTEWKVPLDVHIMSKCPDALYCLQELVVPAMSRVASKVNFTLSYIGTPTEPDDGVACMHGPGECLGNILELCAAYLYPDPKIYLGFTLCMSKQYPDIPSRELVHDCALEHGIAFEKLNECASRDEGAFGTGLLRSSVRHSSEVGVTMSCTIRLNESVRCIRDANEWKQCEKGSSADRLVSEINTLWKEKNAPRDDDWQRVFIR